MNNNPSLLQQAKFAPFLFLEDHPDQIFEKLQSKNNIAIKNNNDNPNNIVDIKTLYFSSKNIDIIQKWLINEVKFKIGISIPPQNLAHIIPAMEAIYEKFGQDLPFDIKEQIHDLNALLVRKLTDIIIREIISRSNYLRDINTASYMDNPMYSNSKGNRILPSTII